MKVKNHRLVMFSGVLWTLIGLMLMWFAFRWFPELTTKQIMWAFAIGVPLGLGKSFIFKKIVKRNVGRIMNLPERTPIWTFQSGATYLLILFMMTFGITMRTTGWIAKKYLAPVYIGIGLALFLSSFNYYLHYSRIVKELA